MRILQITARADIGGGQECLYRLVQQSQGHCETFLACPNEEPYWPRFQSLVGANRLLEIPHRKFQLSVLPELRDFVKTFSIDLVHSHGFGAGLYGRPLSLLAAIPSVHTFHGQSFSLARPLWTLPRWLAELALGTLSSKLIAVSSSENRHLSNWFRPLKSKIRTIPNGIPLAGAPNERVFGSGSAKRILWVGRMHLQKDPFKVIEIAQALDPSIPCTFDMIGEGPLMSEFKMRVQQANLEGRIQIHGSTHDVSPFYAAADILLSTSKWEGLPTCVLEAMNHGLLVVASAVQGNIDLIEHGVNGLLFNYDSPFEAAQLLRSVLTAEIDNKTLCLRARKNVASQFGLESFLGHHMQLYRDLLRNDSRPAEDSESLCETQP